MKKLVSILLALVLTLALSISAFAADANVTIGNDADRDYLGYQLMTLTSSLKNNDTCAVGVEHKESCYNYAYTINPVYSNILKTVTGKNTDDEIFAYLTAPGTDVQATANAIYRAIKADNTIPTGTSIKGNTATGLAQGYWLFADVTGLDNNANKANSVVMLKTHGQVNITVNPKVGLPTVTKKVKDVNDSTGDNSWGKSADLDIGDYAEFELTATVHEHLASYSEYKLTFHDDLGEGFALDANANITVTAKNGDTTLDIENKYTVNTKATDNNLDCDLEVVFANINSITGVTKDTVFTVTYKAKLTENAVVGNAGNLNTVTLEYSNNPYNQDSTGTTSDQVKVYTYKLVIDKKAESENGAELAGAGFTLFKVVADEDEPEIVGEELYSNGTLTQFEWKGLDDGTYVLKETKVPAGYNKMNDLTFTITAEHTFEEITLLDAGAMEENAATGVIEDIIVNNSGTVLPETGAMGTMWLIFGGAMLVIIAGVFMITRKKMSVYED